MVGLTHELTSASALVLRPFGAESPIAVSALVELDDGERTAFYFMSPVGGGVTLDVDGVSVRVLTPASPLGRALIGQAIGSDVEVRTPQGLRQYSIAAVS